MGTIVAAPCRPRMRPPRGGYDPTHFSVRLSAAARYQFKRWLTTLEIARDEEARAVGAAGPALAAAVVTVARMTTSREGEAALARLTGTEASLSSRVRRLLSPLLQDIATRPTFRRCVVIVSLADWSPRYDKHRGTTLVVVDCTHCRLTGSEYRGEVPPCSMPGSR